MTNNKTQNKIAEPGKKVEELKTKLCLCNLVQEPSKNIVDQSMHIHNPRTEFNFQNN